uniref:HERC1 n=1 Tax=Schistocephalus solidus TaxID=70667 RepID=A0A183TT02_SCHSO
LPLFHPSVRALLERQLLERLDHLLTQSPSTAWMLDALVCLAISQDLSSTLLASNAASLSGLSIKILMGSTVGESQSSQTSSSQVSSCPASSQERTPLAAPHLLHLTDYPLRVEAVAACISRWIPRLPQFCGRGDLEEEPFKLLQSGHLVRMDDERLPKRLFCGDVAMGSRRQGGQIRRYKDTLQTSLQQLQINPVTWEDLTRNRTAWKRTVKTI